MNTVNFGEKRCNYCGENIGPSARRCPYCGSLVESEAGMAEARYNPSPDNFTADGFAPVNEEGLLQVQGELVYSDENPSQGKDFPMQETKQETMQETKQEAIQGSIQETIKESPTVETIENMRAYPDAPLRTGSPGNFQPAQMQDQVQNVNNNAKAISNGLKVFLTVIASVIPGIGQLIGIISSIIFINMDDSRDKKSFGVALLIASIVMFALNFLFYLILVVTIRSALSI